MGKKDSGAVGAAGGGKPPKLRPLALFEDEPVRTQPDDHLTLLPFADIVAGAAIGTRGPFTIGVFAEWGHGKTTVLRLAKERVDQSERADNTVTVFFNAWQFEREEHPIVPLIATILGAIEEKKEKLRRAGKAEVLQTIYEGASSGFALIKGGLARLINSLTVKARLGVPKVGEVEVAWSAADSQGRGSSRETSGEPFDESVRYYGAFAAFEGLTAKARNVVAGGIGDSAEAAEGPRFVVFIDDLDRCLPDKAVQLLESIKLVLCQPGFIFVLAVARNIIDGHLQKRYTEFGIDDPRSQGRRYLHKIVQLPLPIPAHPKERFEGYVKRLIDGHDQLDQALKDVLTELEPLITVGAQRTPRTAVRLLNNLLVDDRLRETVYVRRSSTEIERRAFVGLCCVARCLRDELGDQMYEQLTQSQALCSALLHKGGLSHLDDLEVIDEGAMLEKRKVGSEAWAARMGWGDSATSLRDPTGKLRDLVRSLRAATHLEALFQHDHGRAWLQHEDWRKVVDQFFAEQREEAQTPEGVRGQEEIVAAAIRRSLGMSKETSVAGREADVTELHLAGTSVTDAGLVHLSGLSNLRILNVEATAVGDMGLLHIQGLESLRVLRLGGTAVSDIGLSYLAGLTNLSVLRLGKTRVHDAGLFHLKGLTNLSVLRLGSTRVSDAGLSALKNLSNLRQLSLAGTGVTAEGLRHLKDLTNLSELLLSGTAVSEAGWSHIEGLSSLSKLSLNNTAMNDRCLYHLRSLCNLHELHLIGTHVGDAGLSHLEELSNLSVLSLDGNLVSDAGLSHLRGLSKLSTLSLRDTKVTEAGRAELQRAIPGITILI